jgi:hypothetical protein
MGPTWPPPTLRFLYVNINAQIRHVFLQGSLSKFARIIPQLLLQSHIHFVQPPFRITTGGKQPQHINKQGDAKLAQKLATVRFLAYVCPEKLNFRDTRRRQIG